MAAANTNNSTPNNNDTVYDVLIVGGGVVGLSILRAATLAGYQCVLVEQQPDLLSRASGHNSGIACTGVDASPGTLERALIRDSISQMPLYLQELNIPHRPCGSLVCQWKTNSSTLSSDENRLNQVLLESHYAGDMHATRLTPQQVHELEPNLSLNCTGAVHIPGEVVLDPWLYSISLATHARENGATIFTHFEMNPNTSHWNSNTQTWTISSTETTAATTTTTTTCSNCAVPNVLEAKIVINAAGIHADLVQLGVSNKSNDNDLSLDPPHWTAQPKRGQYRIFSSTKSTSIQHPIQPVPTQETKGIFVFFSMYNQIVVGPTALEQSSRTDTSIDATVANQLSDYATSILPNLQPNQQHLSDYVGIRPGTNHRDYQIRLYPEYHWIVAAGIRSTGLTASLGIGRHVVYLIDMILPTPSRSKDISTTPLPDVEKLIQDYHARGDGTVMIHGHVYRVTHPLTRLGWEHHQKPPSTV